MEVYALCACCGNTTVYEMDEEESKTYMEYVIRGREMGALQDLFPKVPNWIRSGAIDQYSSGFCICPECSGM